MTGVSFLFGPPIGAGLANLGGVTAPFLVGSATSVCAAAVAFFNLLSPSRLKEVEKLAETSRAAGLRLRMSSLLLGGEARKGAKGGGALTKLLEHNEEAAERPSGTVVDKRTGWGGWRQSDAKEAEWRAIWLISATERLSARLWLDVGYIGHIWAGSRP
ncbi:hypothetical protein EMIHUDRAFT_203555 [Emiliania huxleyi CCMP1516]|uniref:Major facilitator superfamily (MFS) profile domain-containing protein n=2 Tax=Emiliania huxleyi TaxID=2903 RepID=A0A0D3K2V9_EMIH1|nr:hypothetical protein EMIHUDRAFT_203555 [Emiliania huxleyi CCMP1516]EOD30094.1 hypothetical protein EMIHUDRAFT_203555 [Emiliania huxleyi CCMP1516]|eukprot:XP_005782523.1 hypothetical protein EMIHUDRAFT_203555 [Emiliania huxleyi CCMP1516]